MTVIPSSLNSGEDTLGSSGNSKSKRSFASMDPCWQRYQQDIPISFTSATTSLYQNNNNSKKSSSSLANNNNNNNGCNDVYQRQYSHVYAHRLQTLGPRCLARARKSNPSLPVVKRILDLKEGAAACLVVGTLFKESSEAGHDSKKKKNFAFSDSNDKNECHPDDYLILEDESGRVNLQTDLVHAYSTGVVVAIQGHLISGGSFRVAQFFTPTPPPIKLFPKANFQSASLAVSDNVDDMTDNDDDDDVNDPHVLFLSGLSCGSSDNASLVRDLGLLSYLSGSFNDCRRVCGIVLAGNCVHPQHAAQGCRQLDALVAQICSFGIPVYIMPGQDDPTTANWPQRPLHSSLLPHSVGYGTKPGAVNAEQRLLYRVPNPFAAGLGDKYLVGTNGYNLQDLLRRVCHVDKAESENTTMKTDDDDEDKDVAVRAWTELEALAKTLEWSHICPTGPSSVPTVPHAHADPMVLTHVPHVYFAGNCRAFDTRLLQNDITPTRLVCIPSFAETGQAALVNLMTLDCQSLQFETLCE